MDKREIKLQVSILKKMRFLMLRDLVIFLIVGVCLLWWETMKWEAAVSLLALAYAFIQSIRLLLNKEISANFKRYPIVGLYFVAWVIIKLWWKDVPDKVWVVMAICIQLTGLVLLYQRAMEKEEKEAEVEETGKTESMEREKETVEDGANRRLEKAAAEREENGNAQE